jgi:hypothetical protein
MNIRRRCRILLTCLILVSMISNHDAVHAEPLDNRLYVDAANGNDGDNNCRTPSLPCKTIQHAVNQAQTGDTILVQTGTYTYAGADNPCDLYLGGLKAVICIVNKQLTLRGGYANGDWATPAPAANPTIIDGENRMRGVYVLSADLNKPSETGIEMEGFTVRRGYTRGADAGSDMQTFAFGGGMLTDYAYVTLRDMRFENNSVIGGGAHNDYGGSASGGGAAIRRTPGRATIERVVFDSNYAEGGSGHTRGGYALGGGLFLLLAEADGTSLEFYNNVSRSGSTSGNGRTSDGQSGDAFGAGATVMGYADVTFREIIAQNNRTIGGNGTTYAGGAFGGAIKAEGIPEHDLTGGGINETVTLRIYGCEISNNQAQAGSAHNGGIAAGGGIETIHATLIVEGCNIHNNVAQGGDGLTVQGPAGGGGLYLQNIFFSGPTATVKNSVVAFNRVAAGTGPAVTGGGGGGGGIWLQGIEATLTHNTIVGNRMLTNPLQGSAIIVISYGVQSEPKPAYIRYNIIADHTDSGFSALHVQLENTAHLDHNLFHGNVSNINRSAVGTINGMDTSILEDPLFESESVADGNHTFRITTTSPAVNQAIGSTEPVDIENRPRTEIPDIGAYEAVPFSLRLMAVTRQTLNLYWGVQRGIDQYQLTVECPDDAAAPTGMECNTTANFPGSVEGVTLTGMTDEVDYTIHVAAVDPNGEIVFSDAITVTLTDLFLPAVTR